MDRDKYKPITFGLAASGLLLVGLLLLLNGVSQVALAAPGLLFVEPGGSGTECSQAKPCALQTALAQATDGDIVYFAQGAYTGTGPSVITITQSIVLYGGWDGSPSGPVVRDPQAYPTVLSGEGERRVVYITGNVTPTLDGLIITRGNASNTPDLTGYGGGICSFRATPIIVNCTITGNVAYTGTAIFGAGGGIHVRIPSGTIVITDSRIVSNTASLRYDGSGGGIYILSAPGTQVINNVVMSNTAAFSATSGYGGGIAVSGTSENTLLQGNEMEHNIAIRQGNGTRGSRAYGGGVYVGSHSVVISDNAVLSNTAIITGGSGNGGGIAVMGIDSVVLYGNRVAYNTAQQEAIGIPSNYGGGIYCFAADNILIQGNIIRHNNASIPYTGGGGGVLLGGCDQITFTGNVVEDNLASHAGNGYGGGFHAYASRGLRLNANYFLSNTASLSPWGRGGGLYFSRKTAFTMTNNIVAANHAAWEGGGVAFETGVGLPVTGTLVNNTFAANDRGEGNGRIAIHLNDPYVTLVLTNNLIYSHTYGVYATAGSTATLYNTLFYANSDVGGAGAITNTNPITGQDPLLTADYHLRGDSPAINVGVTIPWLTTDVDGDARPIGSGYDIGADEAPEFLYLPLVLKNSP